MGPFLRWWPAALLVLGMLGLAPPTAAQEDLDGAEFETWTDIATIYKLDDRWRYDGDYGIRSLLTTRGFKQLYLRPSVRYLVNRSLMVHGGLAWFHTSIDEADSVDELRPWVGLRLLGPRPGKWVFSNYFRLELRHFNPGATETRTFWRGRYQLQATSPRFRIGRAEDFYVLSFVEWFADVGSDREGLFASQFRYDLGIGKQATDRLRVELNYLLQKAAVEGTGLEPTDHILRLRLFYRFK